MNLTVEALRSARDNSANVAYYNFTSHLRKGLDGLFCFFEGLDDPLYYEIQIKKISDIKTHHIICKGKQMVLKVYELISNHREYDKYKKAFFVDRDFDNSITHKYGNSVYETPCYSVENLYVSPNVFAEIIKNEFHIQEIEDDYERSIATYKLRLAEFNNAVLLLNAWYKCLIQKKHLTGLPAPISLNDTLPYNYVTFSLNKITRNYNLTSIASDFCTDCTTEKKKITHNAHYLIGPKMHFLLRGKYQMEFLKKILQLLSEDANKKQQTFFSKKYPNKVSIQNIISNYSKYAEFPPCLQNYISTAIT